MTRLLALTAAVLLCGYVPSALGESTPEAAQQQATPSRDARIDQLPPHLRKKVADMDADAQERFLSNFHRWQRMQDSDKKQVKDVRRDEMKRVHREVNRLADELGLAPESEERKRFAERYREERRKVEAKVHEEAQKIRKPLLEKMWQDLKTEFAPSPAAE